MAVTTPLKLSLYTITAIATTLLLSLAVVVRGQIPTHSLAVQILPTAQTSLQTQAEKLLEQGNRQIDDDKNEAALASFQQALTIYRQIRSRQGEGKALLGLGRTYLQLDKNEKAINSSQQSLNIAKEIRDRALEGQSLSILGATYKELENYAQSLDYQQQALDIAKAIKNSELEADSLRRFGHVHVADNNNEKAINYYQQSLKVAQQNNNYKLKTHALSGLAGAHQSLKDYQTSLKYARQRLELAKEVKNAKDRSASLREIAYLNYKLKQYQIAVNYYQQSLVVARELKDKTLESDRLTDLGNMYKELKEQQKAIEYYQQSLIVARKLKDKALESQLLYNIANTYKSFEEQPQALEYYQQSFKTDVEVGKLNCSSLDLYAHAYAYANLGEYLKAVDFYKQALVIERQNQKYDCELNILTTIADAYNDDVKNYRQVIEISTQALTLARKLKNRESEFKILAYGLGKASNSLQEYPKAIGYYRQALDIVRELKNRDHELRILNDIKTIYVNALKDDAKAMEYLQQSLVVVLELKKNNSIVKTLRELAETNYRLSKDEAKSIAYYQQALKIVRERKISRLEQNLLFNLSNFYLDNVGNVPKALEIAEQLLPLAQQNKNRADETTGWFLIGSNYMIIGNLPKAIEALERSVTITKETQDLEFEALHSSQLALTYGSLGNKQKALSFATQALAIVKGNRVDRDGNNVRNPIVEGLSLLALSWVYLIEDNAKQKSIGFAEKALVIARQNKTVKIFNSLESSALGVLSLNYQSLREYPKALEAANQSLTIAQIIKIPALELNALTQLGQIYQALGDESRASDYYKQSLTIAHKSQSHIFEGTLLIAIGSIDHNRGNDTQVIAAANRAQELFTIAKSPLLKQLALSALAAGYEGQKNYPKAIEILNSALNIAKSLKDRENESQLLGRLGDLYRKSGRYQQAISYYQRSLATDPTPQLVGSSASNKRGLARAYQSLNQPTTAITYYKEAIKATEEFRQKIKGLPPQLQASSLQVGRRGEKKSDTYRELADLLLSQGRKNEAQAVLELLKGQELRDFARGPNRTNNAPVSTQPTPQVQLTQTETKILQEHGTLIALGKKIEACDQNKCNDSTRSKLLDQRQILTTQYNQTIATIEKQIRDRPSQDEAGLRLGTFKTKTEDILKSQPNSIVIYPLVMQDKIWLLWASSGGIIRTIEVPVTQDKLAATVQKFRQLLEINGNPEKMKDTDEQLKITGKQLYDWLLKPLEGELKENQIQHLVLALDRETRYIPIGALFDGQKYVIEKYTVVNILSAELTNTRDRLPAGRQNISVLGLGLSEAKPPEWNALKNVPSELNAIINDPKQPNDSKGIYPGSKFLNQNFSFKTLRNNIRGHQIIHMATHGKFQPGQPDDSFILLGDGDKLTSSQIQNLQDLTGVDLLVLSACQTALGAKGQDGVEINSISYYFLKNGVKSIISSLWLVNDASTKQLMREFYTNLSQPNRPTKAEALRQAQLKLLRSDNSHFSRLYYWAPFILIGNGL